MRLLIAPAAPRIAMAWTLLLSRFQFLPFQHWRRQMANRNQDYSQTRRTSQGWRDDDDNSYDERTQFGRSRERDTEEQSGSTGRYAGYGDFGRGEYGGGRSGWSGQERYGQSSYGQGNYSPGNQGGSQGGRSSSGSDYGYSGGGESQRRYGQGSGSYGYGGGRSWNEPSGEGQQYTPRGDYSGERSGYGEEWRSPQGYGGQGSQNYGGQQRFGGGQGSQNYGGQQGYGGGGMGNYSGESSRQGYFTGESSGQGYGGQQGYGSAGVGYAGQGYGYGSQQGSFGSQQGEHRGKGPKGYQRSDERIKEMVCERLRDDPSIDPSEVTITVLSGKITLEGTVDSRQTKNSIEEIAEQFGSQEVQNNLRVQRTQQSQGTQSGESGQKGRGSGDDNAATKLKQH
jgi:osmotically-inducible protein OsmY